MSIKAAKRARIYERDGNRCVQCTRSHNLTLDHIIPISRGGDDRDSNLQTLCQSCNAKKGNTIPDGMQLPKRKRTKLQRLRVQFGIGSIGLQHHRFCDANYCFVECPIYLEKHPQLRASLDLGGTA